MTLIFDLESCPFPQCSTTNISGYMVVKVHFDMTLTFDLEDHICILFLVAHYVVVHIKLDPL